MQLEYWTSQSCTYQLLTLAEQPWLLPTWPGLAWCPHEPSVPFVAPVLLSGHCSGTRAEWSARYILFRPLPGLQLLLYSAHRVAEK